MAGGLILGGALVGGIGSLIESIEREQRAREFRSDFRKGIQAGTARTQKQVFDILQSPEFRTARQFTLGTFGVDVGGGQPSVSNPVSFGGFDFFAEPTGERFRKEDVKVGQSFAGAFDKILTAQRQLRSGVDLSGNPLSDAARSRLEAITDPERIDNLVKATGNFDRNQLNVFAANLNAAGVDLNEFNSLRAASLGRSGEPQISSGIGLDTGGGQGAGQVETPLTADFRRRIQQAQSSRGLFSSQAAASAEASGLAAFEFEQRKQLLPQLLQLATFGDTAFQQFEPGNINREVQLKTGGLGVFGAQNQAAIGASPASAAITGALSGAFAGAQLGTSLQGFQQQQQLDPGVQNVLAQLNSSGLRGSTDIDAAFGRDLVGGRRRF